MSDDGKVSAVFLRDWKKTKKGATRDVSKRWFVFARKQGIVARAKSSTKKEA